MPSGLAVVLVTSKTSTSFADSRGSCFSKCGPRTSIPSVPWELVRRAEPWPSPDTLDLHFNKTQVVPVHVNTWEVLPYTTYQVMGAVNSSSLHFPSLRAMWTRDFMSALFQCTLYLPSLGEWLSMLMVAGRRDLWDRRFKPAFPLGERADPATGVEVGRGTPAMVSWAK